MLKRFFELWHHISESEDLDLPTRNEKKRLKALLPDMDDLNSVTLELQREGISMAEERCLFDHVISDFPLMKRHLGPNAKIVESPDFESAIVKIAAVD
eukprot:1082635-Amorphochlora_amoeboformis.AAC.1